MLGLQEGIEEDEEGGNVVRKNSSWALYDGGDGVQPEGVEKYVGEASHSEKAVHLVVSSGQGVDCSTSQPDERSQIDTVVEIRCLAGLPAGRAAAAGAGR